MSYRDTFSLYSLSLILLLCPVTLLPGDNHTGKVYFEDPVTGSTSMTGGAPKMPNVPMDITPNIPETSTQKGGSSGWGIFGFIANLGRKSAKEIRSERVREAIDRAEAKSMAGIPWDSADYAATGTADLTKAHTYTGTKIVRPVATTVTPPTPVVVAPVAATVVAQVAASMPAPTSLTPPTYIPGSALPKGVTCVMPADFDGFGGVMPNYDVIVPKSFGMPKSTPQMPNMESLVNESPFKNMGNNGPGGGIGAAVQGAGTLIAGTGLLANAAATTGAASATATEAAVVGGTAATGGGLAAGVATVVIPVAVAATGVGIAWYAILKIEDYFGYHNCLSTRTPPPVKKAESIVQEQPSAVDWEARRRLYRYDDGFMGWDNIVHARSPNGGGSSSGNTPKGSNNTPSSPNNPQDPKKPRRTQPLSKTEAYAKIRDRYEHFNGNTYRLRDGKKPIKTPNGKDIERVEWDHNHGGEWEAYTDLKGNNHVGALDPETLELYKPAVKGRKGSN